MVKSFFEGIAQFIRGWVIRYRFKRAIKKCERINMSDARRHIVVNFASRPLILCKADFRNMRIKGVFRRDVSWSMLIHGQITKESMA